MPEIACALVSHAKITTVRALVRQIYVQIAVEHIHVGVLTRFLLLTFGLVLLRVRLLIGLSFLLLLRLVLPLLLGLIGRIGLILPFLLSFLLLPVLRVTALHVLLSVLRGFLRLLSRLIVLRALRLGGLSVLGVPLTAITTVTALFLMTATFATALSVLSALTV